MFPEGRIKEQNIGEEILFVLQKKEINWYCNHTCFLLVLLALF